MFKTGSPVKGQQFIDRKKHIPALQTYLNNGQHTMIKAPRRFGKTSLVKHVLEHLGGYSYIYTDIRRATTLEQLAYSILDSAYALTGIEDFIYRAKNRAIDLFKSIQKTKIESIGELTLQMTEKHVNELELLMHALDVVDKIAYRKGVNIVFVMDEFQDVVNLGDKSVLDKMRSVMQHHENVTYVFLGSIESMMTRIFENKASPFFHFSRVMHLKGLDVDEVFEYCKSYFEWHKHKVIDGDLIILLEYLEGHPDYSAQTLQRIYYAVLEDSNLSIDKDLCIQSLAETFMENKAYLEELVSKAKLKKHHYEVLYATANGLEVGLSSAILYKTRISLEDMGLLKNEERGQYVIVDVFLKIYLCIDQTAEQDVFEFLQKAFL